MPTTSRWSGTPSIRGSTEAMRMFLLNVSLIGLQFTWGLEMTYCTPYLLQLGLTKSSTSLVWIAGPLSGLIMQPIAGALADRSTSKHGRRRPFMVVGSAIVGVCLLMLGWTSEIVGTLLSEGETKKNATIVLAVLVIYVVDFAINAVQSCCRSLIVDTLPISKQQAGSAWAARVSACGHVISYFIGTFDLVAVLPWVPGDTQFKKMTVVSTGGLWITVAITSWAVTERRLLSSAAEDLGSSVWSVLPGLWKRTINLPPRIQAICWSQFWGWIGWFPFLFYSSTWVGETYYRYEHAPPEPDTPESHDALGNIGRMGSLALVVFSIVTFGSAVILPYFVRSHKSVQSDQKFTPRPPRPPRPLATSIQSILTKAINYQPSLVTAWMFSNLCFAAIMFWAPFVRSVAAASTLVALCGIPWAVSCWAPFAEIGLEINKLSTNSHSIVHPCSVPGYSAVRASIDVEEENELATAEIHRHARVASDGVLRLRHADDGAEDSSTGELAGVYLGVLNVYTTLPQFVGTFVSWIVFSMLEQNKNDIDDSRGDHHRWLDLKKNAPNAISVCLFIGAVCAVVAAEATRRLRRLP